MTISFSDFTSIQIERQSEQTLELSISCSDEDQKRNEVGFDDKATS
jgi:hypothetical protein